MRFLRRIFFFVFFGSMLYTVFNYIPLIEEEVGQKKTGQTAQQDNPDGGGEGGKDDDKNAQDDLFPIQAPAVALYAEFDAAYRRYLHKIYIPPLQELNTPPPRQIA